MATLLLMVLLTALYVFLIAPALRPRKRASEFLGLSYAHRGLHTKDGSVPENSLAAFHLALKEGYAIELDVRLSADGEAVVFHDESLRRMTGDRRSVKDLTLEKLKALRLLETEETIPTLLEVLALVAGKVPLLVEVKQTENSAALCEKVLTAFEDYDGLWCVESFDPTVLRWFRRHAPKICRGQLTASRMELKEKLKPPFAFLLANVMGNFLSRPHFLSHGKGALSLSYRMCALLGAAPFVWTVTDEDDLSFYQYRNLSVIFEHIRPRPRFRRRKGEKEEVR